LIPARVAKGWLVATTPFVDKTGDRRDLNSSDELNFMAGYSLWVLLFFYCSESCGFLPETGLPGQKGPFSRAK
jgi:hypothetical protein